MIPEKKIDPEKIHLLNIRTVKGNIDNEKDIAPELIGGHSFSLEVQSGMDISQKIIGMMLIIGIEAMDKKDQKLGIQGSYTHELVFQIENLEDFIEVKEVNGKKEDLTDAMLVGVLIGIGYSTVRGIIYSRTQGTSLGAVILPVIDPKKLIGSS